jgi:hypothetical protein
MRECGVVTGAQVRRAGLWSSINQRRACSMPTAKKSNPAAKSKPAKKTQRWSQHVTETSDAMDLKPDVFKGHDPKAIARSIKSSAEHSDRRKSDPYRSAISMLTFYINRAGHNLAATQRKRLEAAKDELRALFGKAPAAKRATAKKIAAKKTATKKTAAKTSTKNAATKKTAAKKSTR